MENERLTVDKYQELVWELSKIADCSSAGSSIVVHAVLAFAQAGRPHISLQGHPPEPLLSYPAHDRLSTADGECKSKPSSDESSSKLQPPALTHSGVRKRASLQWMG